VNIQQDSDNAEKVEIVPEAAPMNCCQLESSFVENPSGTVHIIMLKKLSLHHLTIKCAQSCDDDGFVVVTLNSSSSLKIYQISQKVLRRCWLGGWKGICHLISSWMQ